MKIDLKTKNRKGKEITEIMGEMKMKSEDGQEDTNAGAEQPANDEEDLLALMDQAK